MRKIAVVKASKQYLNECYHCDYMEERLVSQSITNWTEVTEEEYLKIENTVKTINKFSRPKDKHRYFILCRIDEETPTNIEDLIQLAKHLEDAENKRIAKKKAAAAKRKATLAKKKAKKEKEQYEALKAKFE